MHYSLTSCQLYFLVPLSSFLAHLLALSHNYIYIYIYQAGLAKVVSPGSAQDRTGYRVVILDSSGSAENRSYGLVAAGKAGTQTQHRLQGHDTRSWWGIVFCIWFSLTENVGTYDCWFYVRRNGTEDQEKLDYHFGLTFVWVTVFVLSRCVTRLLYWSNKITADTADSLLIIFHSIFWS